jgi:hypothetical protein
LGLRAFHFLRIALASDSGDKIELLHDRLEAGLQLPKAHREEDRFRTGLAPRNVLVSRIEAFHCQINYRLSLPSEGTPKLVDPGLCKITASALPLKLLPQLVDLRSEALATMGLILSRTRLGNGATLDPAAAD